MALPITPKPQYPNVPNARGVPSVFRRIGQINSTVVLLLADAKKILNMFAGPKWGLFTQGVAPPILPDSVIKVSYRGEAKVATAPLEQGAFYSYNKVQEPFAARVIFAIGGFPSHRQAFLKACEGAKQSLGLYDLVMPDGVKKNVNVIHYDFERSAMSGLSLMTVDVWVQEIRLAGAPAFSNTAAPSGANPQTTGAVAPATSSSVPEGAPGAAGGLT